MNTHVVTRALPGPNGLIPVGTEIDAADFRKVDLLIAQRYLRPLQATVEAEFEEKVLAVISKHAVEGGALANLLPGKAGRPRSSQSQ